MRFRSVLGATVLFAMVPLVARAQGTRFASLDDAFQAGPS